MGQEESKPKHIPTPEEINFATWKEKAKERQQQIFLDSRPTLFRENLPSSCMFSDPNCEECYRHGGSYRNDAELNTLKKMVGTVIFGPATNRAAPVNSFTGFNEDQMSDIVNNGNFVPERLYFLDSDEKKYHIPSDHGYFNDKKELQREDYLFIGHTFLNVPAEARSQDYISSDGTTATVHFEDYGLVCIKIDTDQHIITLKHIKKSSESFLE